MQVKLTPEERFWPKVDRSGGDTDCWRWMAYISKQGYGRFSVSSRKPVGAHRFAYTSMVGPIPDGLQLDHLCRNRWCVNPAHLEPVTNYENMMRGNTFQAKNKAKTCCPRGHPYDLIKHLSNGDTERLCRTCKNQSQNQRRALQRAAAT